MGEVEVGAIAILNAKTTPNVFLWHSEFALITFLTVLATSLI
jgi:hypothetical protein